MGKDKNLVNYPDGTVTSVDLQPKPVGIVDLIRKVNELTESPLGKMGLKVLEKELDLKGDSTSKDLQKYKAYRFLYAMRDFVNGTALTFIGYSLFFVVLILVYRYFSKVLGV